MLSIWIIAQILIILYTLFAAWHHIPAVKAMRRYVPSPNVYEDEFHFWSFFQAVIVGVALSALCFYYYNWFWSLQTAILCVCWYWRYFDIWVNKGTDRDKHYLADHGIDGFVKKVLGKNAGKKKAVILKWTIIKINIIALIFL